MSLNPSESKGATERSARSVGSSSSPRGRSFALAVIGIVLVTTAMRVPALVYRHAIDDEAVYSIVANEMVDGGRPYIDAVERKPPLLFWTYSAVFELAGSHRFHVLHAVALLWTFGTMAGLYLLGRRLFARSAGLLAALFYGVFSSWGTWKNLAFNGEVMMNLPLVWAFVIAFARPRNAIRPELLASGALLGCAFLLKQPAGIATLPLALYLLLPSYRRRSEISAAACRLQLGMFAAGFFLTLGLVALILHHQGLLSSACYWTIYAHQIHHIFWMRGVVITLAFLLLALPLVLGTIMTIGACRLSLAYKRAELVSLIALLCVSAIGTSAGARFYPHYYIQLVPPLALLSAPWLARLLAGHNGRWRQRVFVAWMAALVIAFTLTDAMALARRHTLDVARYVGRNSSPSDRIFVWGHGANIYVDSKRRPACRYILTYPLTGQQFGGPLPGIDTRQWIVPEAWSLLQQDFAQHPPIFIVDLCAGADAQYPVRDFPILARILAEDYRVVRESEAGVVYRRRGLQAHK